MAGQGIATVWCHHKVSSLFSRTGFDGRGTIRLIGTFVQEDKIALSRVGFLHQGQELPRRLILMKCLCFNLTNKSINFHLIRWTRVVSAGQATTTTVSISHAKRSVVVPRITKIPSKVGGGTTNPGNPSWSRSTGLRKAGCFEYVSFMDHREVAFQV